MPVRRLLAVAVAVAVAVPAGLLPGTVAAAPRPDRGEAPAPVASAAASPASSAADSPTATPAAPPTPPPSPGDPPVGSAPTAPPDAPAAPAPLGAAAGPVLTGPPTAEVAVRPVGAADVARTWRRGCPVGPGELRRVEANHWGLDLQVRRGALVVHADVAGQVATLLERLYRVRFPIAALRPVEDFGGSTATALAANATFAFECSRRGDDTWGPHSYGRTLLVNPVQNPHRNASGSYSPDSPGRYHLRRVPRPGMVVPGGVADRTFAEVGWRNVLVSPVDPGRYQAPPPRTADVRVETVSAADLPYSYRPGCPVGPSSLRRITVNHWGWDGTVQRGELIVHRDVVPALSRVFTRAFDGRFPLRRLNRVDHYRADDERAMAADNTSAFNCRKVTGNPYRLSQHSYGNAIDVNTFENPYVTGGRVYPPGSEPYLDRSPYRKGMILTGGVLADAFVDEGWLWGARWANPDYQHFSSNGG